MRNSRNNRRRLMAKIAAKRKRHQSVAVELRQLIRVTTHQLRRECRAADQPQLPL